MNVKKDLDKYMQMIDTDFVYEIAEKLAYDEDLSGAYGFRTAGSDCEHKTAEYIAGIMAEIGLKEIEKVPVKVDKWQFNSSSLKIQGVEKEIHPVSYPAKGTGIDGITAEIVDLGHGTEDDYKGKDVEGKIVLISVDLWNDAWINFPYYEAYLHGAAALVSFDYDGYCRGSDYAINVHENASEDLIPLVSISADDGKYLQKCISEGKNTATLVVDNEIAVGEGVSYNVVGRIPGKNRDKQILLAGHYDKYFYGFQDDGAAIALTCGMAKAMIESGYEPENDIVIVSHGAEEWGIQGSRYDWAFGSWKMITEAKPEWKEKTIALFNFEMPAYMHKENYTMVQCVPEFGAFAKEMVDSADWYKDLEFPFSEGFKSEYLPSMIVEDGISYRFGGHIPYFINMPNPPGENNSIQWLLDRYHTIHDDKDTFSKEMAEANMKMYGGLIMTVDKRTITPLDFCETARLLLCDIDDEIFANAGLDSEKYRNVVNQLYEKAEVLNAKITEVNTKKDAANVEKINNCLHNAFGLVQDKLVYLAGSLGLTNAHEYFQSNIKTMQAIIEACERKETRNDEFTGVLDLTIFLNGFNEGKSNLYSKKTIQMCDRLLYEADDINSDRSSWGTGKSLPMADTYDAIQLVKNGDFVKAADEYSRLIEAEYDKLKKYEEIEIAAIIQLTDMINEVL